MGDLSEHFSRREFRDHESGALEGPSPRLIAILEAIRSEIGRPLIIVSGYRTPASNKKAGGAPRSYHRRGRAADIRPGLVRVEQAIRCGAGGIGVRRGWVVHVDDRQVARPVIFDDP